MDGKGFYKFSLILLALVLSLCVEAQNLVPNPSFEEYSECPHGPGEIGFAYPWRNVLGSCDYFNECGTNGYRVSVNIVGGGGTRTGQANGHFLLWSINNQQTEILGVGLINEMSTGVRYRVEFYLSMTDSMWYASKNFGAYLSAQQPSNNIDSIRSYQPQVRYEGDFITEKEGWTLVSGSFVAQGGERFLSIGNFDKYEDTETLFIPGGGVNPWHSDVYWSSSAYFIDDVSVIPDTTTAVGEVVKEERSYKLYPNPNTGAFMLSLNMSDYDDATIEVLNMAGQQVHSQQLANGSNTITLNVAAGLYLYRVTINGTTQWTGKVSITSH